MAKRKREPILSAAARASQLSDICKEIVNSSKGKFKGRPVFLASEAWLRARVLPLPCLALEWLLAVSGLPLGIYVQIMGAPASCKSAFVFEVFRWFRMIGGGSTLLEHETKFSSSLFESIVNFNNNAVWLTPPYPWDAPVHQCQSVEEWQRALKHHIEVWKKVLTGTKQEPGPGKVIPWVYAVDSILGKSSEETQAKVNKDGSAGRSFPIEAMSISRYLQSEAGALESWPGVVLMTNHLKPVTENGIKIDHAPGGESIKFQESLRLKMTRIKDLEFANWSGKEIQFKTNKNSMGPDKRSIVTRVCWKEVPTGDSRKWRQITWWNWHWSTTNMLLTRQGRTGTRVKEILSATQQAADKVSCKRLGIKPADAVSFTQFGRMVSQDAELIAELRDALAIQPVRMFEPARQYQELAMQNPPPVEDTYCHVRIATEEGTKRNSGGGSNARQPDNGSGSAKRRSARGTSSKAPAKDA